MENALPFESFQWEIEQEREELLKGYPVHVHYVRDATPRVISLHSHTNYELILFCEGRVQYLLDNERYVLRHGDLILIPPGVVHAPLFWGEETAPYARYTMALRKDVAEDVYQYCPALAALKSKPLVLHTAGSEWGSLSDIFKESYREAEQKQPGWGGIVLANTMRLMIGLSRAGCLITPPAIENRELLDDILAYVGIHYREKLTVPQTARSFHISERTLNKLFKDKMGIGFHGYLTQRRLSAAERLIMSGANLEEAAARAGFSDYSAFYRAFKKKYDAGPAEHFRDAMSFA